MRRRSRISLTIAVVVVTIVLSGLAVTARSATADGSSHHAHRVRRDPVLLVHGFDGSAKSWRTMEARLRAAGYRVDQIDAISYDSEASTVSAAHVIARAVDELQARTGAARVDLVSHSLGAIASRYYVEQLGGDAHVDAWVSLAGVNDGTVWAYGCILLASCRDMVPGSSVLDTLARDFRADGAVRFATWWSPCDPVIVPSGAATIPGAQNTETACLGHSDLKSDATVFGQVARFVGQRHRPITGQAVAR
jgi:triacylglycerol lipase